MARAKKSASKGSQKKRRAPAPRKSAKKAEPALAEDVIEHEPAMAEAMPVVEAPLTLPDCLDSDASAAVKAALLERRGKPLVVDAGQVRRVGAQSLQILIAAARTWQADGHAYAMTNPSNELLETLALVGLPPMELLVEGTTP